MNISENIQRLSSSEREEYIIEAASDFIVASNDYSFQTAKNLVNAMYKNFGTISFDEKPFHDAILYTLITAIEKTGESMGLDGSTFWSGVCGTDTLGRSIRDHAITFSGCDDEKFAAMSFDAGRKWAENNNYTWPGY